MGAVTANASSNREPPLVSPDTRAIDPAPRAAQVRALMRDYSIEVIPHPGLDVRRTAELLGPGRTVYVTSLPGLPVDHNLATAAQLARAGLKPVPHLAARRIPSHAALMDFLARGRDEVGTDDLLLIAGDERRVLGPYPDGAAVIESGLLERSGVRRIGIAGYPGGHPALEESVLRAALMRKCDLAQRAGLEARIVTQFSFEPARIVDYQRRLDSWGVPLPLHVGLAGLAHAGTLLKFARRCGVKASLRMLRAHGRELANLLTLSGPDAALLALAGENVRPARIHFFPFGGVERTVLWANAIAEGAFEIERDGTVLAVRDTQGAGREK
jgi:methylenetetrahydrofolate reductase (NADPH)